MASNEDVIETLRLEVDVDIKGQKGIDTFVNRLAALSAALIDVNERLREYSQFANSVRNISIPNIPQVPGAATSATPTAQASPAEIVPPSVESATEAVQSANETVQATTETVQKATEAVKKATEATKENEEEAKKAVNPIKKFAHSIGGLVKQFARIAKMRAIRAIIRTIVKGFQEGVQNLARYSAEFNKTMSDFATSTLYLKNGLGTLAQPVLELLLPALEKVIDAIVTAINWINEMIALVQGEATFTAAKRYAVDYAEGLDSANKSAKALKRTLLGFDELNVLSDNSSLSGSGSGGRDYSKMFEERAVDASPFQTQLAMQIQDVLFNWDNLSGEDIAEKVVTGICGLTGAALGFVLAGVPGALVGSILGIAIGLIASSIFFNDNDKIDPNEIVDMVLAGLGLVAGAVIGAMTIGGVTGGVVGATIGLGIGLGLAYLNEKLIKSSISTEQIKEWANNALHFLISALIGVTVAGISFAAMGSSGIGIALTFGLVASLISLDELSDVDFYGFFEELATGGWEGFKQGWKDGWEIIKKWFKEKVESFIQKVKDWFGIHSPSTVFAEIGEDIIQGLLNGIREKWEDLKAWFDEKKQKFEEFRQNLTTKVGDIKNSITSKITETITLASQKIEELKTKFQEKFSAIGNSVSNAMNKVKTTFENVWNGIKSGTKNFVNGIIDGIEWLVNKILYALNSLLVKAKNIINNLPESVKNALHLDRILAAQVSYIQLPRFEQGGFPEDGLFMANHTELVGEFSNGRTAVANNQQITQGIKQAAYEGFKAAMKDMGGGTTTFVAQLNGETLFKEVVRQNNTASRAYGASPLMGV